MTECDHTKNDSWWEYDLQGIPLCRVCQKCEKDRLRKYSPAVLDEDQCARAGLIKPDLSYEDVVDEPIEG
jgi:hypothetical protein